MQICLPRKEQMVFELMNLDTPPFDDASKVEDIVIGDLYLKLVREVQAAQIIEKNKRDAQNPFVTAVKKQSMTNAKFCFHYKETTNAGASRSFNCCIYLKDNQTDTNYFLGGIQLVVGDKGELVMESALMRDSAAEVCVNAALMFSGLAKTKLRVTQDVANNLLISNKLQQCLNSKLYVAEPSANGSNDVSSTLFTAVPSKEFFKSVSKDPHAAIDIQNIYTTALKENWDSATLEDKLPFNSALPKKTLAIVEPFEMKQKAEPTLS